MKENVNEKLDLTWVEIKRVKEIHQKEKIKNDRKIRKYSIDRLWLWYNQIMI